MIHSNRKGHLPLIDRIRKEVVELAQCVHCAMIAQSAGESGKCASKLIDYSVNLNPIGRLIQVF